MATNPDLDFRGQVQAAAEASAKKQMSSLEHALRQAFYDGVMFEMERRRDKRYDIPSPPGF